jgi:GNAT superfamily N-acetyltransferase
MLLVEEVNSEGANAGDDGAVAQTSRPVIVGGALAFGKGGITLRAIGLEPHVRRQGLGRRLMTRVELEAMRRGAGSINLGAEDESKGFYARLGYAGRGTMMRKGLPLPGAFLQARLRRLAANPVEVIGREVD